MKIIAPVCALIALVTAFGLASWIRKCDDGNERMKQISGFIREGAFAFLRREYKFMAVVIAVLFVLLFVFISPTTGILYLIGALLSVLAGFFGMNVATLGNVRTAAAAKDSGIAKALRIAFRSGSGSARAFGCLLRAGSGQSGGVHHRVWVWCFFHGAVRQGRRRHLYQGG